MQEEIHAAQCDMIAAELGGSGAKYKVIREVKITKSFKRFGKKVEGLGLLKVGDEITAIEQGFTNKGTARLQFDFKESVPDLEAEGELQPDDPEYKPMGVWCSYHDGGVTGPRNFALVTGIMKPARTGKLFVGVLRHDKMLVVTVYRAKGLKDVDMIGSNDNYVKIFVNGGDDAGEEQRTTVLDNTGANPMWGEQDNSRTGCLGETFEFENIDMIESIAFQCWDEDEGMGDANDDLIGQCSLPLAEVIDFEREAGGHSWTWSGWRTVRESSGELPADIPDLDAAEKVDRGEMPPDIPYHVAAAAAAADRTKQTAEMTKLAAVKSKEKGMAMKEARANRKAVPGAEEGQEETENPLAARSTFEMEDGTPAGGCEMDGIPAAANNPEAGMNGAEADMNGAQAELNGVEAHMNGAEEDADIEEV